MFKRQNDMKRIKNERQEIVMKSLLAKLKVGHDRVIVIVMVMVMRVRVRAWVRARFWRSSRWAIRLLLNLLLSLTLTLTLTRMEGGRYF